MAQTVLIIDDDINVLRLLRLALKREGFETETARDGREGIERIKQRRPALIILDLVMPKMDGMELARLLKGHPAVKDIPIIMLTAKGTYENMRAAYDLGTDLFITKPVKVPDVLNAVRQVLGGANA